MDADAGDLAAFADRHDDEVERHAAVDGRAAVGLGDQRHRAALLEIADRAVAAALVGRLAGELQDAERVGRRLARPLDLIAEQGHRAVGEPVQQRRAFRIVDRLGLGAHLRLHRRASRRPRRGRRRARGAARRPARARPLASARSSSIYMIDSRRLAVVAERLDRRSACPSRRGRRRPPGGAGGG